VDHQQAAAVGSPVDRVVEDAHAGEAAADPPAQRLVVVARQVHDAGAPSRAPQQSLQHPAMPRRPEPLLLQPPAVDGIADQVEIIGLDMLQEIQETVRLAARRAEMDVGDEHGPISAGGRSCRGQSRRGVPEHSVRSRLTTDEAPTRNSQTIMTVA
jgi:hypothetical protein